MPEASELMEQMEHAGHGGGQGKLIGLTMALLGVFLALCSALVGASRTELIASMVEQTGASLKYQTVSTKYRMIEANLVQLHSLLPDPKVFKDSGEQIAALEKSLSQPDVAGNQIMAQRIKEILTTVTPTHTDMMSFVNQLKKLDKQAEAALEWSESYEGSIAAHAMAAEHFEWGQLCAELGIVVCSVALLLGNKPAWFMSILLGVVCVGLIAMTASQVKTALGDSAVKISAAEKKYADLSGEDKGADEELFKQIESEGGGSAEQPAGHTESAEHPAAAEHAAGAEHPAQPGEHTEPATPAASPSSTTE